MNFLIRFRYIFTVSILISGNITPTFSIPDIPISLKSGNEWVYDYKRELGDVYTIEKWGTRNVRILAENKKHEDTVSYTIRICDTISTLIIISSAAGKYDTTDTVRAYTFSCTSASGKLIAIRDTTAETGWLALLLLTTRGLDDKYDDSQPFYYSEHHILCTRARFPA